jgi:hypothetical protein
MNRICLPKEAITQFSGPNGPTYRGNFGLEVSFDGGEMQFKLLYQSGVFGTVDAIYD